MLLVWRDVGENQNSKLFSPYSFSRLFQLYPLANSGNKMKKLGKTAYSGNMDLIYLQYALYNLYKLENFMWIFKNSP